MQEKKVFPKLTAGERDQAGLSAGGILKPAWSHGAPWWPGTLSKVRCSAAGQQKHPESGEEPSFG